ncbi:MAG: DNA glycosylase AlkZ-like family protein, partial [Rhodanobacteraceae bacterium]
DYFRSGRQVKETALDAYVESGELIRVAVEGWKTPGYVHADHRVLCDSAARGGLRATHSALLSPFDPIVWHRERAMTMFDFEYRLECYVPAPKRRWGYYVLPILHRGRIVGRLDAKAHRGEGVFEVKVLYLEEGVAMTDALLAGVASAIQQCADWHATPKVRIGRTEPRAVKRALQAALRENAPK